MIWFVFPSARRYARRLKMIGQRKRLLAQGFCALGRAAGRAFMGPGVAKITVLTSRRRS